MFLKDAFLALENYPKKPKRHGKFAIQNNKKITSCFSNVTNTVSWALNGQ